MNEKTKKIILYILLCIVTLGILFGAIRLNKNRIDNMLSVSYIKDYLTEIKYKEIENYIAEQPNAIIYVSNSRDEDAREFERNFSKVIKKYNLENEIVYININDTNLVDINFQNAPVLIFYNNKEVFDMIDCNTLHGNKAIIKALKERNIIND